MSTLTHRPPLLSLPTRFSSRLSEPYFSKATAMLPHFYGGRRSGSGVFDPFSLIIWEPFKDSGFPQPSRGFVNTRVDWKETNDAHAFKAGLPGLKKEEVKVEIEDDRVLQISGEVMFEKEDKNDTWHRLERSSGKFSRSFRLPENVKASMENGVLTVTVPKLQAKKSETRSISISG